MLIFAYISFYFLYISPLVVYIDEGFLLLSNYFAAQFDDSV